MKKILFIFLSVFLLNNIFCQVKDAESSKESINTESINTESIKAQGKRLLKDAGSLLKNIGEATSKQLYETGKQIGEQLKETSKEVMSVKCVGNWYYKSAKTKTMLSINEDGTMEIKQRTGLDTKYWKGVYIGTSYMLTFSITEEGRKEVFKNNSTNVNKTWLISYNVDEEKMKVSSISIPDDESGTDFSKGVIFTKN